MTETADVSSETLRLMSLAAAVNCGLAALGVAIACYVYFYIPHSPEVRYTGKYGEVVSSAATFMSVFPAFQVWIFVMSLIGRRGANRPHFPGLEQRSVRVDRDPLYRATCFVVFAFELAGLTGTVCTAVLVATHVV